MQPEVPAKISQVPYLPPQVLALKINVFSVSIQVPTWRLFYDSWIYIISLSTDFRPLLTKTVPEHKGTKKGTGKRTRTELERTWKGTRKTQHSGKRAKKELEKDSIFSHSEHMNKWRFQELGKNW